MQKAESRIRVTACLCMEGFLQKQSVSAFNEKASRDVPCNQPVSKIEHQKAGFICRTNVQ